MKRVLAALAIVLTSTVGLAAPASAAASPLCEDYTDVGDLRVAVEPEPSTSGPNTGASFSVCVHVRGQNIGFGETFSVYRSTGSYYPGGWLLTATEQYSVCYGALGGCGTATPVRIAYIPYGCWESGQDQVWVSWGVVDYRTCV